MTLNKEQAQHEQDEIYNGAVQDQIRIVLKNEGPCFCGQVARVIEKSPEETRWHLTEMQSRGEISYNWIAKRYSV